MSSSYKILKPSNGLTLLPVKIVIISALKKSTESRFVLSGPVYLQVFFITMMRLSHIFFRIVKCSSIHRLQFSVKNVFIAPIVFNWFATLSIIYLRRSVRVVVVLKCCWKSSANEYDLCTFLSGRRRSDKWTSNYLQVSGVCYIYKKCHTATILLHILDIYNSIYLHRHTLWWI